ncbi:UNVERIFIED_CONTAM: hypothetical protein HDU68_008828 [Siphonaria sp. JEL0065]|nr:hypothetical protein HDU68_008828 [Siphonaria sp. JEL0065]
MSFSHSKRPDVFAPSNDTPGPTDYEVKANLVSDDKNKKFGFLETTKRFKSPKLAAPSAEHHNDDSSNSGAAVPLPPNTRRPLAPSAATISEALKYKKEAEKWQEQYERQLILHQKDMGALEERLGRLDIALKEAVREKNALTSAAAVKEKELSELARKHNLLKSNLEKTEKQTSNLAEKATRSTMLEKKITDLEKTTAKSRSLADAKSSTLEKLQLERKELRDLSELLRKQVDDLIAEKAQRNLLLQEAESQRFELTAKLEELEGSAHMSHEELASWGQKMGELQEHCNVLSSQKMEAEARLENVSRALDAARSEWDADKFKAENLEQQLKIHADALSVIEAERVEFLVHKASLENQVKTLLNQVESFDESKEELVKERDSLEALLSEMQARNVEVAEILVRLETSVNEKTDYIANMEHLRASEHTEFEEVIDSLKAALVRLESEAEEKSTALIEENNGLCSHLETGMHEILSRDQHLEAMTAQADILRGQVESLTAELVATSELCETWRKHFTDTDEIKTQLLERIASMEQDLTTAARHMQDLEIEVSTSQSRIEALEGEIAQLNQALEEANQSLVEAGHAHADALALHESQMEELNIQLQDERTYRAGEKDMAEIRIASIQASSVDSLQEKAELIVSLEASIEDLKKQIQTKADELVALANSHKLELGQLRFDLSEQQDLVTEYRERAYDNEHHAEEIGREKDSLVAKHKAEIAAHKANMEEMEAACRTIISEFRERADTLENEKAFVSDELAQVQQNLSDKTVSLEDAEKLVAVLKEKQMELELRIETLNAALEDSQATVDGYKKELDECFDLNLQITKQNSERKDSIHSLQSDLGSFKENLVEANKMNADLQRKLSDASVSLTATAFELNQRVSDLENRLEQETAACADLSRQLEAKAAQVVDLIALHEKEITAKTTARNSANESISLLEVSLETLTQEHSTAKNRIAELLVVIGQETDSHATTKLRAEALEVELYAERDAKLAFSTKLEQVEALLHTEAMTGRDLQNKVSLLESIKRENEAELARLNAALDAERIAHLASKQNADVALTSEREIVLSERRRSQDLSASLESQVAVVADLTAQLLNIKTTLENATSDHAQAKQTMQSLELRLESEVSNLAAMTERADELENLLNDERSAHTLFMNLNTELSKTLEADRQIHRDVVDVLKASLEETKAKLAVSVDYANEIESALAAEKVAHANMKQDAELKLAEFMKYHGETKGNIALLVAALEEEKLKTQQKDERIMNLGSELSQAKAELESERMVLDNLKARTVTTIQVHDEEREAHREIISELQGRSERLASALEGKDQVVKDLETEVSAVKLRHANEVGRRDEEIRDLNERMLAMETMFNEMKAKSAEVEQSKAELAVTQSRAEAAIRKAAEDASEYDSLLEQNHMEIKSIKKENERLQDALIVAERRQAEVEGHLKAQVNFLEKNHKSTFDELKKLTSANADLMGHQNAQQKIRHIAKIKEELMKMKEEHSALIRERDSLRRKNMVMERDLESFKAVVPVIATTAPCDFKFLHSANKGLSVSEKPAGQQPQTGPKKMSRVGREVLAARGTLNEANTMSESGVIPAVNKRVEDRSENSENTGDGDGSIKHTFFVQI